MRVASTRVPALAVGLALAAGPFVSPCTAQSGPWQEVPSVVAPPPRTGFALLPVSADELLMIGGAAADPAATDWIWDGIAWRPTTTGVPRRDDPAVTDFGANGSILFGGVDASGAPRNDTWRRTGASSGWFQVTWPSNPPPLSEKAMAYDLDGDRAVLIGRDATGTWQTWFYATTSGWQAGATFGAAEASLLGDPVRREVLLVTGRFPTVEVDRLEGLAWAPLLTSGQAFSVGEAAFDPRRGRAVFVQRYDSRDTLEWDGLSFAGVTPPTGAFVSPLRTAMAWHARRDELVLVTNYAGAMQTFRYAAAPAPGATWFPYGPYPSGCGQVNTQLLVRAGDVPQPGASHRLEVGGYPGSYANVMVLGLSHVQNQGAPLPQLIPLGGFGCFLLVEAAVVVTLGVTLPQSLLVTLPPSPSLVGARYDAQVLSFDANGLAGTSNGLEVQVGVPLVEQQLVETFADDANRDLAASGDTWGAGAAELAWVGGSGRHGSFDAALGELVAPDTYEWSTDQMVIPGTHTMSGVDEAVTDGRFYFTDLHVPAGTTVRFVGSAPAQLFVRGSAQIEGTISADADDMPFFVPTIGLAAGARVSNFNALGLDGQPGGRGGPGGGGGGDGAAKCLNTGPLVVGGVTLTDGQPGDDVRVAAGHAYLGQAAGTGGAGSPMEPPAGVFPFPVGTQLIGNVYVPFHSAGGGGGGYAAAGGAPTPFALSATSGVVSSPLAAGGAAFPVLPLPAQAPAGYSSLEHFAVGGSGGGGGGSHGFGAFGFGVFDKWRAGHGGSGGGGVLVVRAGGRIWMSGSIQARGGRGVIVNGDNPATTQVDTNNGISSPGGGGSGGSVLLQSDVAVLGTGAIDVRGGEGSRNDAIVVSIIAGQGRAGDGAPGYYRGETRSALPVVLGAASQPPPTTANVGALTDRDDLTGSRSRWLLPSSPGLPVYVRYELLVDVGGVPVLMSDDPDVSPLAADDPNGPALLRFQGAALDPLSGGALAGSEGPWRTTLAAGPDSLNRDRARTLRFDLVTNKALGLQRVLELRLVWR